MDTRYNRVKEEMAADSTGAEEECNPTLEQEGDKDSKQMKFVVTENNETVPYIPALNRKRKHSSESDETHDNAQNKISSDNLLMSSASNTSADEIQGKENSPAKLSIKHHKLDFSSISRSNSESSLNIAESNLQKENKSVEVSEKVRVGPISPVVSSPDSSRSEERADSDMKTTNALENSNAVAGPSGIRTETRGIGGEIYTCNLCDKEFGNNYDFDIHYRTHTDRKLFVCNVCQRKFTHKTTFENHYRTHTNERTFVCDICKKKFSRKECLDNHYKLHTGKNLHVCDACQRGFTQKRSLDKHYRTHTGEKPHVCDICQRGFTQKSSLKMHYITHTGEKPHVCDICQKAFAHKVALKIHYRTHTHEKPFVCEECKKCFKTRGELTRHEQTHTREQTNGCRICGKVSIKSCNCYKDDNEKQE